MKSLHNILILLFCSLLLFQCKTTLPTGSDPNAVTFSDINFELVIRESVNKHSGDITKSDMLTITYLEGWSKGIISIDGIEYCENLEVINLWDNQISDISALAGLTKLTGLSLPKNQISDISALVGLTSLIALNLSDNQITNISVLADLINIETLDLATNQVNDISALVDLTNLEYLNLSDNQIADISALAELTNLSWLELYGNQITDIFPLVQNQGINTGDYVELINNPLSETSINTYIPQLQARGVFVNY